MLGRRRLATSFVEIWVSLGPLSKKWSIQSSKYKKWLVLVLLWWFWQFDVGGASKFKGGLCLAHKVQNVEPLPVTTWNKADYRISSHSRNWSHEQASHDGAQNSTIPSKPLQEVATWGPYLRALGPLTTRPGGTGPFSRCSRSSEWHRDKALLISYERRRLKGEMWCRVNE